MEIIIEFPQKTKNRVAVWSSNSTPGHIFEQGCNSKRYAHSYVHKMKTWRQPEWPPAEGWTRKTLYIYTWILLSRKKEWNNAICGNMDEPRDYPTKWSKSKRGRQCAVTYKSNLNHDTNEPIHRTNRQKEQTSSCQVGGCIGSLGLADALYREWTNNKVLLYSTGTCIQYPVINHTGKRYKKEYTYIQLNHFAEQQKLTQHGKSTVLQ